MNHFMKSVTLSLVLATTAAHAGNYKSFKVPHVEAVAFDDPEFMKEKKEWTKLKRKLASATSFNGSDVSSDFQTLRDEWLKVKTGDEMEGLLKKSHANYNSYSEDTRYFLAQMHTAIPFRGIVWKLRPLFENSKGFLGNKSTHVTAIQAVRGAAASLKMFLPTKQSDAMIQFLTEPSVEMTKADQFKTVAEFQNYMVDKFIPVLNESISRIQAVTKNSAQKVYVWDHKIAFGRGTFEDDIQRFTGHGPAEMNFTIASLYRAYHEVLVFAAYNHDYAVKLVGELGSHLGVDSSIIKRNELGLTDKERSAIVRKAAEKHHFLELRNYDGSTYGTQLMKQAYNALMNSVVYAERSFEYLQSRDGSQAMSLNPILFQQEISPNLNKGIQNMKAVVSGLAEVRDPVTGDTVAINVKALYNDPPQSLSVLMPTGFESGEDQKTIKNKQGENLVVRNYLVGRSIAWDNGSWSKYVPSAAGKGPGYMAEARRIIAYSFGTSMVFGLPEMFVD